MPAKAWQPCAGYWDEALKWAAGWIAHVCETTRFWKDVPAVANSLCDDDTCSPATRRHKITLASELLIEMGTDKLTNTRTSGGVKCLARIQTLLLDRARSMALPPVERAESGRLLGLLRDPRPGVVPRTLDDLDEMEFCFIPPGPFWMGGEREKGMNEKKPGWLPEQETWHRTEFPGPGYWMARYPVTVAQFNLFVEAKGYTQAHWWPEAIAAGHWQDGRISSFFWSEQDHDVREDQRDQPGDSGPRFTPPNHPVVDVTWYEALAFCRWLESRLHLPSGFRLILPSEAEWEKTARGGEQRIAEAVVRTVASGLIPPGDLILEPNPMARRVYPWGEDFDPDRANCEPTGINATSAAGCFPKGSSPYGVHDLSGNVWEWTRSLWGNNVKKPSYGYLYKEDGREEIEAPSEILRVLRGGSWFFRAVAARSSFRFGHLPGYLGRFIGFRVVVSPFDSGG